MLALFLAAAPRAAGQSAEADVLTVPSPAEFFAALDKIAQPDWAAFYRDPVPTAYPVRPLAAINLGALVTDGYVAVEAQDGQQVKNNGKDIITLARALGVGEHVLGRGKSISDFADKNDWSALKEELDATTNEVRLAMAGQRDEGLAALITAGAWVRAVQVGARVAESSGEPAAGELLVQPELLAHLREDLGKLPQKIRDMPACAAVETVLAALEEEMKSVPADSRAARINKTAGDFVAAVSAKQK